MSATSAARAWEATVRTDYALAGNSELHAERESLQYDLADAGRHDPTTAGVVRILTGDRLKLVEAELARRERIHAAGGNVPDPNAASYQAWRDLARDVRERADVSKIIRDAGYELTRGRSEYYGPCPLCGGDDRFRAWTAEDGRRPGYWCRRCGISGDAIAAYRNFLAPNSSFFDACRVLALGLGLRTPDHGCNRPPVAARPGRRIVPLHKEARRVG